MLFLSGMVNDAIIFFNKTIIYFIYGGLIGKWSHFQKKYDGSIIFFETDSVQTEP